MSKQLFPIFFLFLLGFGTELFGQSRVFRGREAPDNEQTVDPESMEEAGQEAGQEVGQETEEETGASSDDEDLQPAELSTDPDEEDFFNEFSEEEDAAATKQEDSKSRKRKKPKKSKKKKGKSAASEEAGDSEELGNTEGAGNSGSSGNPEDPENSEYPGNLKEAGNSEGQSVVTASDEDYSFSTDRAFHHPKDLLGYTFCPRVHIKDGIYKSLEKGRMSIIFSQNKLSFEGMEEVDSFYYISDISKQVRGFEVELLDMDKPSVPMLMMVYVDDYGFATKIKMITLERDIHEWTLPNRPKEEEILLDEEYTNVFELTVSHYDSSLVGQTIVPWRFAEESPSGFGILTPEGKLSIVFEEDLVTISGNELTESYEILKMTHYINTSGMERAVMIEAKVKPQKGKKSMMYIHLDEWSQIEVIRLGGYRFYLKP